MMSRPIFVSVEEPIGHKRVQRSFLNGRGLVSEIISALENSCSMQIERIILGYLVNLEMANGVQWRVSSALPNLNVCLNVLEVSKLASM